MHLSLSFWILVDKDTTISAQNIIDVPHEIVGVAIESIVMGSPTLVGAEFLVQPTK